jgi:dimethylglycine dehydrogenase
VKEDYVQRHEVAYPGKDRPAARPVRMSSLYSRLGEQGAVFEQLFGWERPYWFADEAIARRHHESFRRTPVQRLLASEVKAVRERAGVIDLSGFAKIEVAGPDSAAFLDRLTTNRLPSRDGALCLTYCLNATGTIEFELTCLRLATDRYYLALAALDEVRLLDWFAVHRRPNERVELRNLSDSLGCVSITGPEARRILGAITDTDLATRLFRGFPAARSSSPTKPSVPFESALWENWATNCTPRWTRCRQSTTRYSQPVTQLASSILERPPSTPCASRKDTRAHASSTRRQRWPIPE